MDRKTSTAITGKLGKTSKMPGLSWGISAKLCNVGARLAQVSQSVCSQCYALRAFYRYPSVTKAHAARLRLFNESLERDGGETWVAAMAYQLRGEKYFRFLDSGDLQSVEMLDCFLRVAKATPKCKFWIPTREYEIVSNWINKNGAPPANVVIRLSGLMVNGPAPSGAARRLGVNTSRVVSDGSHTCHAVKNDNQCGHCRLCWNKKIECVSYKKH